MFVCIVLLALMIGAIIYCRPKDHGQPHSPYFQQLQKALQADGPGHPVLVLDMDRLDQNIATSQQYFSEEKAFRIVAKSLPSLPLLNYICTHANTHKIMAFHRPFLSLMIDQLPTAEFLLGKPFPVQAAKIFFTGLDKACDKQATSDRIQWLIDSKERAQQYLQLAQDLNLKLKLNIEIDVGLHRGGVTQIADLTPILSLINANADALEYTGFMGYEPHVAKVPLGNSQRIEAARHKAMAIYQQFINCVKHDFPALYHEQLTFNGAGSPTYQLYRDDPTLNDLCAGSSLVKPTDFDLATLTGKEPALFIATPVIKRLDSTNLPFIEAISALIAQYNPNWQQSLFTYGGYWKAKPCSPQGLHNNPLYGRSSNQEIFNMSANTHLEQDDYIFLRPTQSEGVMLEFTDLLVIRDGKIVDKWTMFTQDLIKYDIS